MGLTRDLLLRAMALRPSSGTQQRAARTAEFPFPDVSRVGALRSSARAVVSSANAPLQMTAPAVTAPGIALVCVLGARSAVLPSSQRL
jgi:hypothetical protein